MESYAMFIPPKAKTVVEFGCGSGQTGEAFKRIQPQCCYWGWDKDAEKLKTAAARLDRVSRGDAADFVPARFGLGSGQIDCLIYHGLPDNLAEQAELLADDGQILFFAENGSYLPHILSMVSGTAPVLNAPLSLASFLQSIKNAGLTVDKVTPLYRRSDQSLRDSPQINKLLEEFTNYYRSQNIAVSSDIWAKNYVIRAVKTAPPSRLIVQAMIGEERVTARVRISDPQNFIGTIPGVDHVEQHLVAELKKSMNYPQKVLILHRLQPRSIEYVIESNAPLRKRGYLVVSELDDSPAFWREAYEKTKYVAFTGCHAVQVSTEPLKEEIKKYNPHVVVFANHLKELPPPRIYEPQTSSVNIFFGALNRQKDWEPIMAALNRVLREYDDRVTVTVMFDRKFYEELETPHKVIVGQEYPDGYAPYKVYTDTLHTADISLLPLVDNERSRMKSDLKFIESAAHGAAVLAAPVVYAASVRDGGTGLIYHTPQEFAEKLRKLIDDRELRQSVAESAYDYVRRHRLLAQHYEERVATYRELISRWQELDDDLTRRLEKLTAPTTENTSVAAGKKKSKN